jgi:hypothetical protein
VIYDRMTRLAGTDTLPQIAKVIGVHRITLQTAARQPGFPKPVAVIASTRVYRVHDVAIYMGKTPPGW